MPGNCVNKVARTDGKFGNRKKATAAGRMFKGLKTCFKGIWDISEAFLGIFRHLKPDFGAKNRVFH